MKILPIVLQDLDVSNPVVIHLLADVHIGASNSEAALFENFIDKTLSRPNNYAILLGDLINNGIKDSKSNVYEERYPPKRQKEIVCDILSEVSSKVLLIIDGNHEDRTSKSCNINITYDIADKLNILDRYQSEIGYIKVVTGTQSKAPAYMIVGAHGASANKVNQFLGSLENADIFVSGHTHRPKGEPTSKLTLDPYNNVVRERIMYNVVATGWQSYASYAARGLYKPTPIKPNHILLNPKQKEINIVI